MPSSLSSATIRGGFQCLYQDSTGTAKQSLSRTPTQNYTNGTGATALQANIVYQVTLTITASGSSTLNLTTGLTDQFGQAIAATRLKAMLVEHLTTTTATAITIGGSTNPLFGTKLTGFEVNNGDHFQYTCKAGYTISSGSADRIRFVNADASNSATVRVTLLLSQ